MNENEISKHIVEAAIEVHRTLGGPGLLENVYEEALSTEFDMNEIAFERQKSFALSYKGKCIGDGRMDFLVGNCLVVEIKAVDRLMPIHRAQVMSYLKARKSGLGLLINFNERMLKLGVERIIWSERP